MKKLFLIALVMLTIPSAAQATEVVYAACPGYEKVSRGCYIAETSTIYVAEHGDSETLLHETGHAFDHDKLTDRDRRFFSRLVGMPRHAWFGKPGRESPGERFADAYAAYKSGVRAREGRMQLTGYGFVISADGRYRRICNAIAILELIR